MGDSFYHIFTTKIPILYTLFFGLRGVGIHNAISKNYHMSDITLISREICDKRRENVTFDLNICAYYLLVYTFSVKRLTDFIVLVSLQIFHSCKF
jgi:hypothetical protein